jgi:hypothetical protein
VVRVSLRDSCVDEVQPLESARPISLNLVCHMPPTITDRFPPLPIDELIALIDTFPKMAASEKIEFIRRLTAIHPTYNVDWGQGSIYRRCRPLREGEMPQHVNELIWRSDITAQLGRANPAGFNVLYLANRPDTAFSECKITECPVVLTDFVIKDAAYIRVAPIGEMIQTYRTGRGYITGDNSGVILSLIEANAPNAMQSLLITDASLLNCFNGPHEISSEVALAIFNKHPDVNAIAYASTQVLGAVNFAVRVEDFWDAWAIRAVRYGRARHLSLGVHEMEGIMAVEAIVNGGELRWGELDDPDGLFVLNPPFWKG